MRRWLYNWLAIGHLDRRMFEVEHMLKTLDNSQSDAFDAISRQATMIEEMKKDIKLLVEENIELRRNLPKSVRQARNFTDFRTAAENQEITQNAV